MENAKVDPVMVRGAINLVADIPFGNDAMDFDVGSRHLAMLGPDAKAKRSPARHVRVMYNDDGVPQTHTVASVAPSSRSPSENDIPLALALQRRYANLLVQERLH